MLLVSCPSLACCCCGIVTATADCCCCFLISSCRSSTDDWAVDRSNPTRGTSPTWPLAVTAGPTCSVTDSYHFIRRYHTAVFISAHIPNPSVDNFPWWSSIPKTLCRTDQQKHCAEFPKYLHRIPPSLTKPSLLRKLLKYQDCKHAIANNTEQHPLYSFPLFYWQKNPGRFQVFPGPHEKFSRTFQEPTNA